MNLFKIILICFFGNAAFSMSEGDMQRSDKSSGFTAGFSLYNVIINEPMEEFVQDLTTEINNLKQKNPYVSCTLDFIEQHGYTITTNLAAQLATSYLAENDTYVTALA